MFLEIVPREVVVPFHDIDNDRPPGFNVPWLCFVQQNKASDDVRAQAVVDALLSSACCGTRAIYGNLRYQCCLSISAAPPPLLTLVMVHPEQNAHVSGSTTTFLLE